MCVCCCRECLGGKISWYKWWPQDFPGSPVVKTPCFYCQGHGFDPWLEWRSHMRCSMAKKKQKPKYKNQMVALGSWVGIRFSLHWTAFSAFGLCSLCGSDGKESTCNAGDPGSIPGWGRSPREGNGNLKYSCLENSMGRGTWQASWGHKELNIIEQLTLTIKDAISLWKLRSVSKLDVWLTSYLTEFSLGMTAVTLPWEPA